MSRLNSGGAEYDLLKGLLQLGRRDVKAAASRMSRTAFWEAHSGLGALPLAIIVSL